MESAGSLTAKLLLKHGTSPEHLRDLLLNEGRNATRITNKLINPPTPPYKNPLGYASRRDMSLYNVVHSEKKVRRAYDADSLKAWQDGKTDFVSIIQTRRILLKELSTLIEKKPDTPAEVASKELKKDIKLITTPTPRPRTKSDRKRIRRERTSRIPASRRAIMCAFQKRFE